MRRFKFRSLTPILLILAVIGYLLPWVITPAQSLSIGAYDLAEWTSLHPIVRQTLPFLWTTLALRVPLAILGILLSTYAASNLHSKTLGLFLILITAIALLPPLEFFTVYRSDPNYQQQFFLALITLFIGILMTTWHNKRLQQVLPILLSLIGCIASIIGIYQGYMLIQGFALPAKIGAGGLLTVMCLAVVAYLYITKQSSQTTLFALEMHTDRAV